MSALLLQDRPRAGIERGTGMIEEEIEIPMHDGTADAVLYRQEDGPHRPGVLHLTDIGGIRPANRGMARRLAAELAARIKGGPVQSTTAAADHAEPADRAEPSNRKSWSLRALFARSDERGRRGA